MNSEDIQDESYDTGEQAEWRFNYWHAVGLIVLLGILQFWVYLLITKSANLELKDITWIHVAMITGVSGVVTAWAGATLTGFSIPEALDYSQMDVSELFSGLILIGGASILASELNNLLQWAAPITLDLDIPGKFVEENLFGVLFTVGVIAPVTEELIFRGVIFQGLKASYSLATAVVVSAALFALVHGHPWSMVNAFLLGLLFAMVRIQTGSLLLCVVIHSIYNMIPFLLTRVFSVDIQGYTTGITENVQFQPLWFDALGLALFAIGFAGIRLRSKS